MLLKNNIDKYITKKLDNYYIRSTEHYDDVLFDTNGDETIKALKEYYNKEISRNYNNFNYEKHWRDKLKNISKYERMICKCFIHSVNFQDHNYRSYMADYFFYKEFIILKRSENSQFGNNFTSYDFYAHNFSNDVLFFIKYVKLTASGFNGLNFLTEHPEYFRSNCNEFESICKREYEMIKQEKEELERLKNENIEKIEYYKSLEQQIKDIEDEKQKLIEEKNKMKIVKEKLTLMKKQFENEKKQFENEKIKFENEKKQFQINNVDVDNYFDDV